MTAISKSFYDFSHSFKLSNPYRIKTFFVKDKTSLLEKINVLSNRVTHFYKYRKWIDQKSVLHYVATHPTSSESKLSTLFKGLPVERKIQRIEANMCLPVTTLLQFSKDSILFLIRFFNSGRIIGSVIPSFKSLAKSMVRQIPKFSLDHVQQRRLILEVGPGTGVFTERIVKRMGPLDELHLVEFDPSFCKILHQKYKDLIETGKIKIFNVSIIDYELQNNEKYDFIISGLPFNAFQPEFVLNVFNKYEEMTKKNGKISYFEYMLIPTLIKIGMNVLSKNHLIQVLKIKESFYQKHPLITDKVWKNFTPAYVRHHQLKSISD